MPPGEVPLVSGPPVLPVVNPRGIAPAGSDRPAVLPLMPPTGTSTGVGASTTVGTAPNGGPPTKASRADGVGTSTSGGDLIPTAPASTGVGTYRGVSGPLPVVRVSPTGTGTPVPPGAPPDAGTLPVVFERVVHRAGPDSRPPTLTPSRSPLPLAVAAPGGVATTSAPTPATVRDAPLRPAVPGRPAPSTAATPPRPAATRAASRNASRNGNSTVPAAPAVDVDRIADAVHRRFLRQLAVEGERRGVR